jgi:hypothetical protein
LTASDCWYSAGPHPAGLVIGYANPPEHADQPLTYDDVELDDGSTILSVGRLQDLLLRNDPPTSRPSVRDAEVLRTRMGLPMPQGLT